LQVGTLPNILTITRILLLPLFATLLIYRYYDYALILFLISSVTDVLDGLIARAKKQVTAFGSILDPVADKFLMTTSFIILTIYGWIPKWLTITILSRDLIIVTGWLMLYFVKHNSRVEPSILGKAANACQFLLVGLVLLSINIRGTNILPLSFLIIVSVFTAGSGIGYIYKGLKMANG